MNARESWKKLAEKELRGRSADTLMWATLEGIEVQPVYGAEDAEGLPHMGGVPGQAPYTRGPKATMYAGRPWTIDHPRPGTAVLGHAQPFGAANDAAVGNRFAIPTARFRACCGQSGRARMKSIIITGASSGIGRATAQKFLGAGWRVGLLARRADKLEALAKSQNRALVLACDVTDAAQVDIAFADFAEWAGRLDVLFNNAGRGSPAASIDEIDPDDWRAVVEVNLTGMFFCARAAFGQMRRQDPQGGRIDRFRAQKQCFLAPACV